MFSFALVNLFFVAFSSAASVCDIRTKQKTTTLKNCEGQAVLVEARVTSCNRESVSAALSDLERKRTFATFSDICSLKKIGYECRRHNDCLKDGIWVCEPSNVESKCHERNYYYIYKSDYYSSREYGKFYEKKYEKGFFEGCSTKSYIYLEAYKRHINMCTFFNNYYYYYYDVTIPKGFLYPIFDQNQALTSKKQLVCVPSSGPKVEMILNNDCRSNILLNFKQLNTSFETSTSENLSLPRQSDYQWDENKFWKLAALKIFSLKDSKNKSINFKNFDEQFLQISIDKTNKGNFENKTEKLVLLSMSCEAVKTFDGSLKIQDAYLYKTFSETVSLSLSKRSQPKIKNGSWFLAIFTHVDILQSEESLTMELKISRYGSSYGVMFIFPVISGIIINVSYYAAFYQHKTQNKDLFGNPDDDDETPIRKRIWKLASRRFHNFLAQTVLITVVFWVPAFQYVWANYFLSQSTGNKDVCFYNDKCYFPSYWMPADIPANAISSNIPYMAHGFFLIIQLIVLEQRCYKSKHHTYFDYSASQAVGFSIVTIGIFSMTYHICPSRTIFQLDTNGMFFMATLVVVSVFQGWTRSAEDVSLERLVQERDADSKRVLSLVSGAKSDGTNPGPHRKPFRASPVFLSFLCPMIIFNFLGSVIDVEDYHSLSTLPQDIKSNLVYFQALVAIAFFTWYVFIVIWGARKNNISLSQLSAICGKTLWRAPRLFPTRASAQRHASVETEDDEHRNSLPNGEAIKQLLPLGYVALILLLGILITTSFFVKTLDTSAIFMNAIVGASILTLVAGEIRHCRIFYAVHGKSRKTGAYFGALIVYYLVFCVVWVGAFYFFAVVGTSDKNQLPSESRIHNKECVLFDYYDPHDVWHLLSSHGLLLTGLRAATLAFPCRACRLLMLSKEKVNEFLVTEDIFINKVELQHLRTSHIYVNH